MDLVKPEQIKALIAASFESTLPKAVHEATGELVERIVEAQIHQALGPMFSTLSKAENDRGGKLSQSVAEDPKGLLYDPFTSMDQLGFRERPSALTYRMLQEMARRVSPYTAIVQTRINQIAAFADPQLDEHSLGFKIKLKDRNVPLTGALQKRADEISRMITQCGMPELKIKRDKFNAFLRKGVKDSLILDQWTVECIPQKRSDDLAYWRTLDAATMRISDTLDEVDYLDESIQYVQVYDDTIIAEFTEEELIFGVRNPSSDIRCSGYGTSELELLISVVTSLLNGVAYNSSFFTQGSVAKGLINFKGAVPEKELQSFRRSWYAMISGLANAWRTPIVNAEDVQYLNMQASNKDMEWSNFIDWLLKVTCSVCQIAPEEIGFQFGNSGQSSSMSEGSQEIKLKFSKDKGLVPLARFVTEQMNDKIVSRIDDRFRMEFAGINARTAEELIELHTKEVSTVKTVDEIRKERGEDPLPDGLGEVILNPVWLQFAQAKKAEAQQAQQGAQGYGAPPGTPSMDRAPPWQDAQQGDGQAQDGQQGAMPSPDQGQQVADQPDVQKSERAQARTSRAFSFEVEL